MGRGVWGVGVAATVLIPNVLCAQYDTRRLNGAAFAEEIHSDIITQSGTAERRRQIVRSAAFSVVAHGDTLVVTADTAQLNETADGSRARIDMDAIIGARWKLLLALRGEARVMERPVVPGTIADVSDVGTAMDDFFPPAPPRLAIGGNATDSLGRRWHRLPDSTGNERYHYTGSRRSSARNQGDSVTVESSQDASETTDLSWDAPHGPTGWTRHILTTVTTHFAGRTVRAQVEQRIEVRRKA